MSVGALFCSTRTVSQRVSSCKAEVRNGLPAFEQLLEGGLPKRHLVTTLVMPCLVAKLGRKGVKGSPLLQLQQGITFGGSPSYQIDRVEGLPSGEGEGVLFLGKN